VDAFRCNWCGAVLEDEDLASPFHLCFDHLVPDESSELVVSSELFNLMKNALAPDEFRKVVGELVRHWDGEPFDRDCVPFEHWATVAPRREASRPSSRLRPSERTPRPYSDCEVCGGRSVRYSIYCQRCRDIIFRGRENHTPRVRALKEAWDPAQGAFLCHYTGARVDEGDPRSPWYLNLEHRIPGDRDDIVVAAAWVNAMKTALSEREFKAVVREYKRFLDEGGEFDRKCAKFEHWRRSRARRIWR
jgi:hypothetical protein